MEYGEFAHAAYENNIDVNGYKLDVDMSDKYSKVYYNKNEVVLTIRGTASLSDLLPDMALIQGILTSTSRYKNEANKLVKIMYKYKGSKFIVVGHSLGGSIATELAKKYKNVTAYVFNTGSSHWTLAYSLADKLKCKINGKYCHKNIHSFRVLGDPVSLLSFGNTTILPNGVNVHGVANFREKMAKDVVEGDILVEDTDKFHKVLENNGSSIITQDDEILEYAPNDKVIFILK